MTKEQYLFLLRAELDGTMPTEELEDILRYYSEYFEDAGEARERDVMLELGSPQRLAERILEQRKAEENMFETPGSFIQNDGYYGGASGQMPGWVMAILFGIAGLIALPTLGGLILGFGLGGLGCMIGGVIAIVVGGFGLGLAGKLYVVGGGMVAFAVGLVLFVAAAGLTKVTLRAVRYCWDRLTGGGVLYDETGY